MPQQLAALICFVFVLYVLWLEIKAKEEVSWALLIPLVWMFLAGSRYVSRWLDLGTPMDAFEAYQEGSPVDRNVFTMLILAGIAVLASRRLSLAKLVGRNKLVCLFFMFAVLSIGWSDYPFISFKRLIRGLGNLVMALVVLTEKNPYAAVAIVYRRLALLTLPLSVLFIKYYPEMGRAYHQGLPTFTGVALHKNTLGQVCLLTGIALSWSFLYRPEHRLRTTGPLKIPVELLYLGIIAWLLSLIDSATSFACLVVGVTVLLLGRTGFVLRKPQRIFAIAVVSMLLTATLQTVFDLRGLVIQSLGRRDDLTTRVPMWEELLSVAPNRLFGAGYDIFWATPSGLQMSNTWSVGQAHNGYLELYLSLGLIGLVLVSACIVAGFVRIRRDLTTSSGPATLRLCLVPIVALYNWTEATFSGISNMWLVLFIGIIDVDGLVASGAQRFRSAAAKVDGFQARRSRSGGLLLPGPSPVREGVRPRTPAPVMPARAESPRSRRHS